MKIRINETQELKELSIYTENGIEWTTDLLGNHDSLHYNDDDEYTLSQEEYDWWSNYIKTLEQDEKDIQNLADELGIDKYDLFEKITLNCDLEDEHAIIQSMISEIREKGLSAIEIE